MDDDSTRQSVLFSDLLDKPVIAKFDQEHASSDGGAILLQARRPTGSRPRRGHCVSTSGLVRRSDRCSESQICLYQAPALTVLRRPPGRYEPFGQAGDSIMNIRDASAADAQTCGRILYDAFKTLAERHNFPPDLPSPEVAADLASMLIDAPGFYGVVAVDAGKIVGSNFMDERSPIFGIGPISVAPEAQNHATGRRLMCAVLDRAVAQKAAGIRLVQAGYHNRSLCLYTKLGFVTREPLSLLQGPRLNAKFFGYDVRPAEERDVDGCNKLCREIHGFDRDLELREAIRARTASVV
jgi:predicted N-acetyltransferase YhbS